MAKIFSILTLLIAAGAAYLGMESNKLVQTLQTKGQENYDGWQKTKKKLSDTEAELKTMTADRDKQKAELEATKRRIWKPRAPNSPPPWKISARPRRNWPPR
jgi:hypothetical protein